MTRSTSAEEKRHRTHTKLIDALCLLAAEYPGRNITVKELTERARVSRGTFYLHFLDIPDMYDRIVEQTLKDLSACFDEYLEQYTEEAYARSLTRVVDLVDERKMFFRLLLSSQPHRALICDEIDSLYRTFWQRYGEHEIASETWTLLITYHSNGILSCIEKCFSDELPISKDDLLHHLKIIDEGFDEITERFCH